MATSSVGFDAVVTPASSLASHNPETHDKNSPGAGVGARRLEEAIGGGEADDEPVAQRASALDPSGSAGTGGSRIPPADRFVTFRTAALTGTERWTCSAPASFKEFGHGLGPSGTFAGDENDDGFGDFASGTVLPGAPAGIDTSELLLAEAGVFFFASAGDVDGDGYGDTLAFVSPFLGAPERERVYFGGPGFCGDTDCRRHSPIIVTGHDRNGGNLIARFAAAGDVNGDGTDDLGVSTPETGAAYLFLGHAGGLGGVPFRSWTGAAGFGTSLPTLFGTAATF